MYHFAPATPNAAELWLAFLVAVFLAQTSMSTLKNYFHFGDDYFLQIRGVAMGSVFVPSVANLFVYNLEMNTILDSGSNPFFVNIIWYKRYLDDIFWVFSDKNALPDFMNWTIKFSHQSSEQAISFLDMVVYKKNNKLAVRVFRKPTDKNTSLHFNLNHPWHLKTNLPYSQFLRMKHNCTEESNFQYESKTLAKQLRDRGYPEKKY